jgi:transposase InsO family protein
VITHTRKYIGWSKREVLSRLGISRTQQTMFRHRLKTSEGKRLRKLNQITPLEIQSAMTFCREHRGINYFKLAYMMMDEQVAFLPPSTLYRILRAHGFYESRTISVAEKVYRDKPTHVHHTWHTDLAYVKLFDVFYFLIVMLDGYSRYVLDWDLLSDMTGDSVATFTQRVLDAYPDAAGQKVRIVNDNGSCYISADYRLVLKENGITSIRCAPYHPQTNGKAEACIKIVRNEALRPAAPQCYSEAVAVLKKHFHTYNHHRLHSGIGYLNPVDMFLGNDQHVIQTRKQGLLNAKKERALWNQNHNQATQNQPNSLTFEPEICSI